ncbi:MAG: hypothetical protein ACJAVS_002440 [Paracoccaceae bacterium]|jgi:hypothetical protein
MVKPWPALHQAHTVGALWLGQLQPRGVAGLVDQDAQGIGAARHHQRQAGGLGLAIAGRVRRAVGADDAKMRRQQVGRHDVVRRRGVVLDRKADLALGGLALRLSAEGFDEAQLGLRVAL